MNFIRVAILGLILFAFNLTFSKGTEIYNQSYNTSHFHTQMDRVLLGNLPRSYEVKILFNEDNYEHTHSHNGGSHRIDVEVNGTSILLSSGKLKQINGNFNCSFSSNKDIYSDGFFKLTADLSVQKTITIVGNVDESKLKKRLRKDIINIILEKIREL